MPAIYLTNVTGTGTRIDPFRAQITAIGTTVVLMIDDGPRKRAVVWAEDLNATGNGVILFQSAPTKSELIDKLQTTNLTNQQRNQVNGWLNASGYQTIPAGTTTQYDVILFVCRQVNPEVDLSVMIA
jgi:hypothetical protein